MVIERQTADTLVITVVMTNGLTVEHRYPIGNIRTLQDFQRAISPFIQEPMQAIMGASSARAFILANPVAVYNTAHVMTLRIRGEGSSQAVQMAGHVHEMGFLARDRSGPER